MRASSDSQLLRSVYSVCVVSFLAIVLCVNELNYVYFQRAQVAENLLSYRRVPFVGMLMTLNTSNDLEHSRSCG